MPPPPTGRVLVVDDEVDLAQLVAKYLRKAGLDVAVRHDGTEAVASWVESAELSFIARATRPATRPRPAASSRKVPGWRRA